MDGLQVDPILGGEEIGCYGQNVILLNAEMAQHDDNEALDLLDQGGSVWRRYRWRSVQCGDQFKVHRRQLGMFLLDPGQNWHERRAALSDAGEKATAHTDMVRHVYLPQLFQ